MLLSNLLTCVLHFTSGNGSETIVFEEKYCGNELPLSSFALGYSRNNQTGTKGGGEQFEDTVTFWNKSLEFQVFLLCTWKFRTKQSFTLGNSAKLCYVVGKLREQKSRTLEIPHDFFLITPGNSTSFLINPYNFYKLFLDTPGNSISSTPPVFFFK